MEEQRILLSTLIDSLPEIIYAVDTDNRVTVVNRALLDTLNKPRDAVLGHRLSELWTEENVVDIEAQAATTLRRFRAAVARERRSPSGCHARPRSWPHRARIRQSPRSIDS